MPSGRRYVKGRRLPGDDAGIWRPRCAIFCFAFCQRCGCIVADGDFPWRGPGTVEPKEATPDEACERPGAFSRIVFDQGSLLNRNKAAGWSPPWGIGPLWTETIQ